MKFRKYFIFFNNLLQASRTNFYINHPNKKAIPENMKTSFLKDLASHCPEWQNVFNYLLEIIPRK
jgi:hypothetical protein